MGKCNGAARRYLWEVGRCLPCARKEKLRILKLIRDTLDDYLYENPNAGYDGIKARLGEPQQIAASCVEGKEPEELLRDLEIKRKVFGAVVIAAAMLVAIWLGYLAFCFQEVKKDTNGYMVVEIIEGTESLEGGN